VRRCFFEGTASKGTLLCYAALLLYGLKLLTCIHQGEACAALLPCCKVCCRLGPAAPLHMPAAKSRMKDDVSRKGQVYTRKNMHC
jgi:hypothetical protein